MLDMLGLNIEQLLGKPTIHVPMNFIVQQADEKTGKFWGVWQGQHPNLKQLTFGSEAVHQLIMADAFIRPQLVLESNEFKGSGVACIATHAFAAVEKWTPIFKR